MIFGPHYLLPGVMDKAQGLSIAHRGPVDAQQRQAFPGGAHTAHGPLVAKDKISA